MSTDFELPQVVIEDEDDMDWMERFFVHVEIAAVFEATYQLARWLETEMLPDTPELRVDFVEYVCRKGVTRSQMIAAFERHRRIH